MSLNERNAIKTVIVHHAGCPDGFGAAWWLRRNLLDALWVEQAEDITLVAAQWGDAIDEELLTGAIVYVVDYCYEAAQLKWLEANALYVFVLDHHETSEQYAAESGLTVYPSIDAWTSDTEPTSAAIVLDKTRSGIGLVAECVYQRMGVMSPPWVANIEDRDLWTWALADTKDVFATVTSIPYTIEAWDELLDMSFGEIVSRGHGINEYRDQLIEQCLRSQFKIRLGGLYFPCCNAPYSVGSDVGARLSAEDGLGLGAYVILHGDNVQIGVRSRDDGPNVAKIAEQYGGGGHEHAAGLRMTLEEFVPLVW